MLLVLSFVFFYLCVAFQRNKYSTKKQQGVLEEIKVDLRPATP